MMKLNINTLPTGDGCPAGNTIKVVNFSTNLIYVVKRSRFFILSFTTNASIKLTLLNNSEQN